MQALFFQHYPAPIQQAIEENILYIEDTRTYFKDSAENNRDHEDWPMDNLVARSITGAGQDKGFKIGKVMYNYEHLE